MQTNAPFFHVAPIPAASKISPSLLVRRDEGAGSSSHSRSDGQSLAIVHDVFVDDDSAAASPATAPATAAAAARTTSRGRAAITVMLTPRKRQRGPRGLGGGRDGGSDGGSASMDVFAARVQAALASSHPSSSSSPSSPSLLSAAEAFGRRGQLWRSIHDGVSHFFRLKAETGKQGRTLATFKFK